jgi:hypothetical protein
MPYHLLIQVVIETPDYLANAKTAGLTDDERRTIVDYVARNPDAGVEMRGTGGARKIRLPDEAREKAEATGLLRSMLESTSRYFCCRFFQKGRKPIFRKLKGMN